METQKKESVFAEEILDKPYDLVLYNDDVNTFDHVIECLCGICNHSKTQAEQCAYIVHYKGKCVVKKGSQSKLKPMMVALQEQKLSATIK